MTTALATTKFSVSKAHKAQMYLSRKITSEDRLPVKINLIAGIDVAYAGELAIGAAVVLDYDSLELLESQTATSRVKLPYIPTLLSFREIPPAIACIRRLKRQPDVFLVDGQGVAHPFGCGFASHLGLAVGKPTIGVAKSRLIGTPTNSADSVFLVENNQIIGSVVTTKANSKPVYVSIGHLISLETALKIVKHCVLNSRIPQPLSQAHRIASEERRRVLSKTS
jgi:deoxyribonuclease V